MNVKLRNRIGNRKRRIERRLDPAKRPSGAEPQFAASNIHYEMAARTRAINCGGIGVAHLLARQLGLIEAIDNDLHVLKVHLPYHESDHVLNIAYNILAGGSCLEDLELLRNDEVYLDALGTGRIPDPTTAGDFCRRFTCDAQVVGLMETINRVRTNVWRLQPESFRELAILDADGTIAPTCGECKEGMDISYDGQWGYHPLVISLADTKEPLYLVNRPVIVYRLRTFYAGRRMSIGMEANPVPSSACPGCIESARRIVALEAQVAHLNASIERLRREGKRQAAPFSKGSPQRDPKKPGRKRGENHGEHHRREAPPRIDAVHEAELPGSCPHCRGEVMETSVERQYQTEIPRRVIYRQFNVHVGKCRGCDRRVQGRHPLQTSDALGAAASQIGPDAQALAVHLNKDAGLSHGKVKRLFEAAFDLKISRGASCRTMLRASRRCRPVYQAIVRQVRRSPSIVPDETGWRIGGTPAWLHVAVGADATAYLVDRRRGYEASVLLIGEDYEGTMTHDGWSPYLHFIYAVHQTCLAHLLRRASELEEKAVGGAVHFPRRVKAILQSALTVRDRRDAGEITASQAIEQAAILSGHMDQLTGPAKTHVDNERFAKHLRNQQQTLFPFLQFQGIDATNHKAEQAIRPATVNRKVWGGNRTEAGAEAQSVLMSVLRTATQRGTDAVTFISDTLKATLGHRPRIFTASG